MKESYLTKHVVPLLACSLLIAVFLAGCCCINIGDWGKEKYEKTEHLSAPIAAGGTLAVETEIGSITITGADVTDCNVTAEICVKAPTEEEAAEITEQVKIQLVPAGKMLTVKVEKPHLRKRRSISINYQITVPEQTSLQLESDIGKIHISNVTGQIQAEVDVGEIICEEISGDIDLKTDVGKVEVVYSKTAPAACNATIKTDIGKIDFTAPPDFSATVHAVTDVGSIETELPLTVTGKIGKKLHGTIGKGEGELHLKTDIGSIEIR